MKAHQRKIREQAAIDDPRETIPLDGCYVEEVSYEEAAPFIRKNEWLGTMNRPMAIYGMRSPDGELLGVVSFGNGPGTRSASHLCGDELKHLAICLERGANAHHSHEHAPSWFVSRACNMAADDHGWRIFFAYSDSAAGEVGTIYQALGWHYIGTPRRPQHKPGLTYSKTWRYAYARPDGTKVSSRVFREMKKKEGKEFEEYEADGWTRFREYDKGKYVCFYGGNKTERKKLRKALKPKTLPYLRRVRAMLAADIGL